jgi:hypothetical protein
MFNDLNVTYVPSCNPSTRRTKNDTQPNENGFGERRVGCNQALPVAKTAIGIALYAKATQQLPTEETPNCHRASAAAWRVGEGPLIINRTQFWPEEKGNLYPLSAIFGGFGLELGSATAISLRKPLSVRYLYRKNQWL